MSHRGPKTDSLKLSRIYGTELDRVNCPFYAKIGACRHGARCSRQHNKPTASPTVLLPNMYQHPALQAPRGTDGLPLPVDTQVLKEHFSDFFEDVFEELAKYGELEQLNICDNLGDHLVGNVYVKYQDEESAARAVKALTGRYYQGRPVNPEFSPVTDFREATCRQFESNMCRIGPYCNFLHIIIPARDTSERTFGRQKRGRFDKFRPWQASRDAMAAEREGREKDREMAVLERVREQSRERRRVFDDWNREMDATGTLFGNPIHRWGTQKAEDAVQDNVILVGAGGGGGAGGEADYGLPPPPPPF